MTRMILVATATLVSLASPLTAQSDRPATGRWRCDTNTGPATIYATPFFEWTGLAQELQNAFQQHLLTRYGYKERVSCSMASPGGPTLAQLEADMQRQYAQFRAQGKKIVEIPWTITSPGITLPYQCFGVAEVRTGVTRAVHVLHSKVFRIQVGNQGELSLAWIDEVKRLHPGWYFPSPGCNLLPADPAAHQGFLDNVVAMYASSKPTVTAVDWQYRAGAAAETEAEDNKPAYYCERISSKPKTVYITPARSADPAWTRDEYNLAWLLYVRDNLEKETFTGGCEAGTMKQETYMRNRRREEYVNQGYTVRDVDWTYAPGKAPTPAPAAAPAPAPAPAPAAAPQSGRLPPNLRQPTQQTFYCQYLGFAKDASGKYPLYQNEAFSATALQGTVQNAWKAYIEATYRPTAPGNPVCAILPADPAQRGATIKAFNLHTQPGTQTIVKVSWKP